MAKSMQHDKRQSTILPNINAVNYQHQKINTTLEVSFTYDANTFNNFKIINDADQNLNLGKSFYRQPFEIQQMVKVKQNIDNETDEFVTVDNEEKVSIQLIQGIPQYLRVIVEDRVFPMKIKCKSYFGSFDMFYSAKHQKPDEINAQFSFKIQGEKNFLIQQNVDKQKYAYIGLKTKNNTKAELKVWFQGVMTDKQKRDHDKQQVKQLKILEDIVQLKQKHKEDVGCFTRVEECSINYLRKNKHEISQKIDDRITRDQSQEKQLRIRSVKDRLNEQYLFNNWRGILNKEMKQLNLQIKHQQDKINNVIKPKQKMFFTIIHFANLVKMIKNRIIKYKVINYLTRDKKNYSTRILFYYLRAIQYRSITLNNRNFTHIYNVVRIKAKLIKKSIKRKAGKLIEQFFIENQIYLQGLVVIKKSERVLYLISKVQMLFRTQYKKDIQDVLLLMSDIFNVIKKEDGFDKVEFSNIPKYKISYYISVLTMEMKHELAKEYLAYAKKNFTIKKKKFGNLGSDVLNYIKEKKENNLNVLVDNTSIQLLAKLKAEYQAEKLNFLRRKYEPLKQPDNDERQNQEQKEKQGLDKKQQYMKDIVMIRLHKIKMKKD